VVVTCSAAQSAKEQQNPVEKNSIAGGGVLHPGA